MNTKILDDATKIAIAIEGIQDRELHERMMNLNLDIAAIVGESNRLRERNRELMKALALKQVMSFASPFWYQEGDVTPHCPVCWEGRTEAIHVILHSQDSRRTRWDCPSLTCRKMYLIKKESAPRAVEA